MNNDIRYSQAYYSSKHHPVVIEAQQEANTKLPYPHTREQRIEELKAQYGTVEPDTYLERFVKSNLDEAENMSDAEYQKKIAEEEKFRLYAKSEMENL